MQDISFNTEEWKTLDFFNILEGYTEKDEIHFIDCSNKKC